MNDRISYDRIVQSIAERMMGTSQVFGHIPDMASEKPGPGQYNAVVLYLFNEDDGWMPLGVYSSEERALHSASMHSFGGARFRMDYMMLDSLQGGCISREIQKRELEESE